MAVSLQARRADRSTGDDRNPYGEVSFEDFFYEFRPRIHALLTAYVGEVLADDLTQETLLRAHRRGVHLQADRDPWPWLARVARNLATDASRRRGLRPERPLESDDDARSEATPHSEWVAARRREGIAEVLASLPARPRRMLVARHLEGMRYEQIAGVEGVSVAAVRSALYRARRIFREEYGDLAERRGIAALFPIALIDLRDRVVSLRRRLGELLQRWATERAAAFNPIAPAIHGSAAVVAAGALALANPAVGEPEPVVPDPFPEERVRSVTTRPASSSVAEAQFGGPDVLTVRSSRPSPPARRESLAPDRIGGGVDSRQLVPAEQAPARAEGGAEVERDGESAVGRHEATVRADEADDLDLPGQELDRGGSTGVRCPSPSQRGTATSAACPLVEGAGVPQSPPTQTITS